MLKKNDDRHKTKKKEREIGFELIEVDLSLRKLK